MFQEETIDTPSPTEAETALRHIMTRLRCVYWTADAAEKRCDDGVQTIEWTIHVPQEACAREWLPAEFHAGQSLEDAWHAAIVPSDRWIMYSRRTAAFFAGQDRCAYEYRMIAPNGEVFWFSESYDIVAVGPRRWRCTGLTFDVTQVKHLQEQMEHQKALATAVRSELESGHKVLEEDRAKLEALAWYDELTGLRNYRAFKERLCVEVDRAARVGEPLSLIMVDVDRFKQYNDTYGHLAGDDVLKLVARVLSGGAHDVDFVARYGGEEFAIILPTDRQTATTIAERLRVTIQETTWPKRPVTASFGVATWGADEAPTSASALIAAADWALYYCKARGRNRVTHAGDIAYEDPSRNVLRINCGAEARWPYMEDAFFEGGKRGGAGLDYDTAMFDLSAVHGPVSPETYQTERYGDFSYLIPGPTPQAECTVRLHFAETFFWTFGERTFNVAINGVPVLTEFDVFAAAGGTLKPMMIEFPAVADENGNIGLSFASVRNNAQVNAIEIFW